MAGLVKGKKYDWTDSNMEFFGSDLEKEVKKEAAMSEPAWEGAGEEVSLKIWRIVSFEVTDWPAMMHGKLFSGDSYILLNTYQPDPDSEALAYDVHFWIGNYSSQDEYGTAAYKTVELDTYLDGAAVQHREVQGKESKLFLSYFPKGLTIMEGGAESGFNHVTPEEYTPKLLHFTRKDGIVVVKEVPCCRTQLKTEDVFIYDAGEKLYQWNGTGSNKDERWAAMEYMHSVKDERPGFQENETLDEESMDDDDPFYELLTGEDEEEEEDETDEDEGAKRLFKVFLVDELLEYEKVKDVDDEISMDDLDSSAVFILDCGNECFVWVGESSPINKQGGMKYAHDHLKNTSHAMIPITVVQEGQTSSALVAAMAA